MIHIHLDSQGAIRSLAHVAQSLNQGKPLFAMLGEALMTIPPLNLFAEKFARQFLGK